MNNETNPKINPEELTFKKIEINEPEYQYWRGHVEGDQLIGQITYTEEGGNGPFDHGKYKLTGLDGEQYCVLPEGHFNDCMSYTGVGDIVKIVYLGYVETEWEGEGYDDYDVYVAETEE